MNGNPIISVVLGSLNRCQLLKLTIQSIRDELKELPHEIIVVDGGSTDGSIKWLIKQRDIITIIQHNNGEWNGAKIKKRSWGYFMNLGFKSAQGKYVCMLSDDCLVVPGAIKNGCELFEKKLKEGVKLGALAFYWRNWPDEDRYLVGLTLGDKMFVNHGMYLREALEKVDFIDESTFKFYHADSDLGLKMWKEGYECQDSPDSYIEHFSHLNFVSKPGKGDEDTGDWDTFLIKWQNLFYDPIKDNYGSWIKKEFTDPDNTAEKFRPFYKKNWVRKKIKAIERRFLGLFTP